MTALNEVNAKIVFKKEEIVKLQSEQAAVNVEIEKTQVQLKSLTELMDNFSVMSLYSYVQFWQQQIFILRTNKCRKILKNKRIRKYLLFDYNCRDYI